MKFLPSMRLKKLARSGFKQRTAVGKRLATFTKSIGLMPLGSEVREENTSYKLVSGGQTDWLCITWKFMGKDLYRNNVEQIYS